MYYFCMTSLIRTLPPIRRAYVAFLVPLFLFALFFAEAWAEEVPEPKQGMLLVADRKLQDPRFQESVVLLLQAGQGGAGGVIINMPTTKKVSGIFDAATGLVRGNEPLYYGGPVSGHELLMLRRADQQPVGWSRVIKNIFITNNHIAMLETLMAPRQGEEVRLFSGYAGWARGQLEHELRRGDWHLLPADASRIFRSDTKKLWNELFRKSREIML